MKAFVCDLESSGLDFFRNEILSLSCSYVEDEKELGSIEVTFRPESKFWDDGAEKVHGISKFAAARFDDRKESSKKFLDFIKSFPRSPMVCHALKMRGLFDAIFLEAHYELMDQRFELYKSFSRYESTLMMMKELHKNGVFQLEKFSLDYLCNQFSIPLVHHDAKSDRLACQQLYWIAQKHLKKGEL